MIVSQSFVWAHIPKTGGDATATMIQQAPRLIVLADHLRDNAKHVGFDQRRGSIEGKLLAANIRRLPGWAFSYARHRAQFGAWPDYEPAPLEPDAVAAGSIADRVLEDIVGDYHVDVWIRQEHLVDDLVAFLREHAGLTPREEAAVRSVGRVNARPLKERLRHGSARRFFSAAHIETLYASNPRWADIERRVYGSSGRRRRAVPFTGP